MNGDRDPKGSGETRSKPRLVKQRKHTACSNNPKLKVFPETAATVDPGFNPFRPSLVPDPSFSIKGNLNLSNDGFLFDAKTTSGRGFVDNSVLDSMMKLKIESNPFANLNLKSSDEAGNSRIEDELGKLRIESSVLVEENPKNENVKSNLDMDTDTHSFVEMELPDDLKKLNIEDRSEADGSSLDNNVDDYRKFIHKSWNQSDPSFPGSSEGVYFGRAENVLSNEMGSLKLAREFGDIPNISNPSESICSGFAPKNLEFNAKREPTRDVRLKKNRGNSKKAVPVSQDFILRENTTSLQEYSFESYSPMDVSPYREPIFDYVKEQDSRESYVETLSADVNEAATEEDLVIATQCLDINDNEFTERKGESRSFTTRERLDTEFPSYSEAETESFVTADVQFDNDSSGKSDTFVTAEDKEVSSSSRGETEIQGFSCGPTTSEDFGKTNTNFTFAAATSSSANSQSSSSTRQKKKKNSYKASHESYPTSKIQPSSSSMQFFRPSETSSVLSPRWGQKGDVPNSFAKTGDMAEADKNQEIEQESSFTPAVSIASLEACDKWRLRGNQAYANGDMLRAEEYYSQGVNSISHNENSRSCLRALMLCYSNRAATRMSLGRVREALEDCRRAVVIDPNFLRVQVRAANCYLALGDVEDASRHFAKCLQSGNALSAERKLALEASEGLTKSQRVSEWMKQSTELVHKRNSNAAENALEVIAKALTISCYSEKLLELKAEALFMLGKYEELIHLCEQTLYSAEMNHAAVHADDLSNMEYSDGQLNFSFRLWRWRLIIKSYFSLGRLEAALDFLKKQEESAEIGSQSLETTTPLVGTIRKLVYNKGAGNEAFKRGNYAEAVEHYTAALSSTVESLPFAAVCFCNRAAAYKAMDQVIDAIADCSIAIALDGNYLKAISRRASLFEMIRDYDQATKDMQKVESLLTKQVEEDGHFGPTDKLRSLNDLRQAQQRRSALEENAKLEISLNMYLILGVDPSVPASEIKKAYRKAALKHHPDKSCQFFARSELIDDGLWKEVVVEVHKDMDRIFKMIGEAYAILSDPRKRSQYDIDEESRTAQKRGFEGRRMHTFNSPYERESGSSKQEAWKTYGNNFQSRGT